MADHIHTRPLSEKDAKAQQLTDNFTEGHGETREKHAETSDDLIRGMPPEQKTNLKTTTGTS